MSINSLTLMISHIRNANRDRERVLRRLSRLRDFFRRSRDLERERFRRSLDRELSKTAKIYA